MYIICGRCGKRFIDIIAARDHTRYCTGDDGGVSFYVPPSTNQVNSHTDQLEEKKDITCPKNKKQEFLYPRCCHSKSVTELKTFLKATTWWYCKYPDIINLKMLNIDDIEKDD